MGLAVALVTSENFLPLSDANESLAFVVELIAAIPSVVIGLWGVTVSSSRFIVPYAKAGYLNISNWIPLFNTEDTVWQSNMLTAGIILAIMILPTMAAISRDVLLVVPKELRSASMALGATRWETILHVIATRGWMFRYFRCSQCWHWDVH